MRRSLLLALALFVFVLPVFGDTTFYLGSFNTSNDGSSTLVSTAFNGPPSAIGNLAGPGASVAFNNAGMAFGPGGTLYALSNDGGQWYMNSVNTSSGAASQLFGIGAGFSGLAYDAKTGLFYSLGFSPTGDPTLYSITLSGAVNPLFGVGLQPGFPAGGGLAYDPGADVFYAIGKDVSAYATLFRIALDGTVDPVLGLGGGGLNDFAYDGGLTFDPVSGQLYALITDIFGMSSLAQIDLGGAIAFGPALDYGYQGGLAAAPVPEPCSLILLGTGLMAGLRRVRKPE